MLMKPIHNNNNCAWNQAPAILPLLLTLLSLSHPMKIISAADAQSHKILIAKHHHDYSPPVSPKLKRGNSENFRFGRFQSLSAVKRAFDDVRSPKSFRTHRGKDGRVGSFCSTRLGGDWVLAESEQVAPSCTCEDVLRVYLDGRLQKHWSRDKVMDVKVSKHEGGPGGDRELYYRQDLVLHSQRVIRSCTGVMQYSQRIRVDKVGGGNYCALVELDPEEKSTVKKPFNSLSVYVGLQQMGDDVKIYAAGVFEVNRKVVPNLLIFDASGIAGNMAGKGTLWLAGHFEEMKTRHKVNSGTRKEIDVSFPHRIMKRFNAKLKTGNPTAVVH